MHPRTLHNKLITEPRILLDISQTHHNPSHSSQQPYHEYTHVLSQKYQKLTHVFFITNLSQSRDELKTNSPVYLMKLRKLIKVPRIHSSQPTHSTWPHQSPTHYPPLHHKLVTNPLIFHPPTHSSYPLRAVPTRSSQNPTFSMPSSQTRQKKISLIITPRKSTHS